MDETASSEISRVPASADLVVVGAGVAGLLAAWRAAEAGADVVLLDDPERPAASELAAGMIAPVGEASWGEEALLAAGLKAAQAWPGFAAALSSKTGFEVPYRRCGSLHVALDGDEAAELARLQELHERHRLEVKALLGSECRQLEPGLATTVRSGLAISGEAEVDPRRLLVALRAAAAQAGVVTLSAAATAIDPLRATVQLGSGAATAISADKVVLAAGAWSGVEGLLGPEHAVPIRPVGGEIIRLRAESGQLPATRIIRAERFYLVPRASGEVVVGAGVHERGFDRRVRAGAVHELLREASRALPELTELELVETSAGLRPGSPDNAPIVGSLRGTRLIVVGGLYRNGILLTPLLSAGLPAILAGEPAPDLAAFSPQRFEAGDGSAAERATVRA